MTDQRKLAALIMSSYADNDGTDIHCGVALLAADMDASYRTAQRHLAWLRDVGLIELVKRGNRRRNLADEYRLILGPDVMEHVEVPDPTQYRELRDNLRAARHGSTDQTPSMVTSNQHDRTSSLVTSNHPEPPHNQTSALVTSDRPIGRQNEPDWTSPKVSPHLPYTPPLGTTTSPKTVGEDLRTEAAAGRARAPAPKPDFSSRCEHGLTRAARGDGRPACALCRVEQDRAAGVTRLPPGRRTPEPEPDTLATVTPIREATP